jgi:hypothetical protein
LYGVVDQSGVFGPNGNQYTIPGTATLYVPDTSTTGLSADQLQINNALSVYPNPTSTVLNVKLTGYNNASMALYSSTGQLLYTDEIQNFQAAVNMNEYATGLYLLNIKDNASGTIISKRIIKQ